MVGSRGVEFLEFGSLGDGDPECACDVNDAGQAGRAVARRLVSLHLLFRDAEAFSERGTVPTLPVLERLARALGAELAVSFSPKAKAA